jgi:N-methylhydantoinase A/oxoprolinase/acetone carboxylase beta subunit
MVAVRGFHTMMGCRQGQAQLIKGQAQAELQAGTGTIGSPAFDSVSGAVGGGSLAWLRPGETREWPLSVGFIQ